MVIAVNSVAGAQSLGSRYRTLDGMRGIAALAVAAYHFGQRNTQFFAGGYLAVDLFFMLSGFVIALNYHDKLKDGLGVGRFLKMRLLRLYPTYFVGVVLGMVRQAALLRVGSPLALSLKAQGVAMGFALAMLPDPFQSEHLFPLNGPSWSLFFEFAVNVLFALVLVRISSLGLMILAAAAAVWLVPHIVAPDFFNLGWSWQGFSLGLARTLLAFPLGVVLWRHMPLELRRESWGALLVIAVMAVPMVAQVSDAVRPGFEVAVVLLLFPALLALGILYELPGKAAKVFSFLGDVSFAIYAIHWPLIKVFGVIADRLHLSPLGAVALFVGGVTGLAAGVARYFDQPVRGWLRGTFIWK